jgi:hypothetical protein
MTSVTAGSPLTAQVLAQITGSIPPQLVRFWNCEKLIGWGDLTPEFQDLARSFQHPRDEWSGLLNLPSEFRVRPRSGRERVEDLVGDHESRT